MRAIRLRSRARSKARRSSSTAADYRLNLDVMRGALAARRSLRRPRRALPRDEASSSSWTRSFARPQADRGPRARLGAGQDEPARERGALGGWASSRSRWRSGRRRATRRRPIIRSRRRTRCRRCATSSRCARSIVADGELEEVEPLSGEAEREFPEPVGRAKGIYTLHSELGDAAVEPSEPARRELPALPLARGCSRSCSRSRKASCPSRTSQSPESVAVHEVELAANGARVVGTTVTRGWQREVDLGAGRRALRWRSPRAGSRRRASAARACDRGS